jgi:hypothetical protein
MFFSPVFWSAAAFIFSQPLITSTGSFGQHGDIFSLSMALYEIKTSPYSWGIYGQLIFCLFVASLFNGRGAMASSLVPLGYLG